MHPLIGVFHAFSCDCSAQESRGVTARMMGSDEAQVQLWWKAPSQWSLQPLQIPTDVWQMCLLSPSSTKTVLRALPGLLQSLEAKLLWFHLHLLQSMYSKVHRSNFSSSFRLFRLACDNGCVFKVFWKKLAGRHGHVKQGIVFAKLSVSLFRQMGRLSSVKGPVLGAQRWKTKCKFNKWICIRWKLHKTILYLEAFAWEHTSQHQTFKLMNHPDWHYLWTFPSHQLSKLCLLGDVELTGTLPSRAAT